MQRLKRYYGKKKCELVVAYNHPSKYIVETIAQVSTRYFITRGVPLNISSNGGYVFHHMYYSESLRMGGFMICCGANITCIRYDDLRLETLAKYNLALSAGVAEN